MGPDPPRPYGWRVTLANGATIEEFPPGESPNRWDALETEQIEQLELISTGLVQEPEPIVRCTLKRGGLWLRARRVDVVLDPVRLTRSQGPCTPVQRKVASSTHRPGHGSTTRLHGFLIGFERELAHADGMRVRVLAKVSPTGEIGLRIDAPEVLADAPVGVRVDGQEVGSRDRFRQLVGPPGPGEPPCP